MPFYAPFSLIGGGAAEQDLPIVATDFDSGDYLHRSSALTGAANGKVGAVSLWVKMDAAKDGVSVDLVEFAESDASAGFGFVVLRNATDKVLVRGKNTSNTIILSLSSVGTVTGASGWTHILASWDLANTLSHLYIDDVDDLAASPTLTDDSIDYAGPKIGIGTDADATPGDLMVGCMSELYINIAEYIDFSVTANRRKFIDASGKPVNLNPSGSRPTDSKPIIYLPEQGSNFGLNHGSGGNFSETGTLTACADSPAD